jgi:predicted RNase H-like nuclease (RuvC/YqgF family)
MDVSKFIKSYIEIGDCKQKVTQKCEKSVDKPNKISYINNTNETTTNNSKGDKTMENKINELLTLVKHLNARIESLELGNRPQLKKLRENKNETTKQIVKKTAVSVDKGEILKLQKKVREGEKTLTKKQLNQYNFFYGQEWRKINKTIDLNDKLTRSMAFTKARLNCLKRAKTY